MRLIDTQTHLLLEPWKAAGKEYAILSHTWGDQEVIFQEWEQLFPSGAIKGQCPHVRHDGIDKKAGYHKVVQACEQARRDGIRYIWCDTMCINKESSAELSEAINSMFKWYRDAKVCYVYLTDVDFPGRGSRSHTEHQRSNIPGWFPDAVHHKLNHAVHDMKSRFMASRWWTRGWTLQELLAPKNVAFFTQDWTLLGHKSGIAHWISESTLIHREALEDHDCIWNFSIAQRMSWAADRQTTVPEDLAYCLLGIFGINMPMLYGQGESAYQKLQHEIIKVSDDQSIFAWAADYGEADPWTGILAKTPRSFRSCGSIVRDPDHRQEPYALTNRGLKMQVPRISVVSATQYFVGLGCFLELHGDSLLKGSADKNRRLIRVWIPVRSQGFGGYERIHTPTSHVYFQYSYPTTKVLDNCEIYFPESPHRTSLDYKCEIAGATGVGRTGIAVSIGFGNMSMVSRAYRDVWHPQRFQIIPIGSRQPNRLSHEVIVSGSYCIILSVAWDSHLTPRMHTHTTLHDTDARNTTRFLEQLRDIETALNHSGDAETVHRRIRSTNDDAVIAGKSAEGPMIVVEDEPFHDAHRHTFVLVDIIFTEKISQVGRHRKG